MTKIHRCCSHALCIMSLVCLTATRSSAQRGTQQDSTLNNLVHQPGYVTAPLGELGAVVRTGTGPIDVVIIPGWGFGAGEFAAFMKENAARYRMTAITLPGFGGTAAPPMPPPGTSYAEATWMRAAESAIARLITRDHLRQPIIVGHFIVGSQIALRLAIDHPEIVGGVVVVGGESKVYYPSRRDPTGKTAMSKAERIVGVDSFMAPRWFKTVTHETWDAGNYPAALYSIDSTRAAALWKVSAAVPMPVMIRYLCEYSAMDMDDELRHLRVPTYVLAPTLTDGLSRSVPNLHELYVNSWQRIAAGNSNVHVQVVDGSRVFVSADRPDVVREVIAQASLARERR